MFGKLLLSMMTVLLIGSQASGQTACDRDCLRNIMTDYLNAMVAHRPETLPLAANVRFTEDRKEMKLGDGIWKTATRLRPYRQDIIDVRQGVAGAHVIVEEGASPTMLVVRLKVVDHKITEVETMAVRNRTEGAIFVPDALKEASKAMTLVPDRSALHTREDAIKIAEHYPNGLRAGSFVTVDAPFAPDAYRFEGGQLMAGPGCTFMAGCENIKTQRLPKLSALTYTVAAVDEEMGIVWLHQDFGPGSMGGPTNSLDAWEYFKVYGGQIHAVEAFMEIKPATEGFGWK